MHAQKYCLETGWLGQKPWFLFPGMTLYVQFVHLALWNEDEGVELVYKSTCCLALGVIF